MTKTVHTLLVVAPVLVGTPARGQTPDQLSPETAEAMASACTPVASAKFIGDWIPLDSTYDTGPSAEPFRRFRRPVRKAGA